MDSIYIFKYHVAWADESKITGGEGFVFAADYRAACEELKKMYGSYISKLYIKKVGAPNCYVLETKENGKEMTDRWY